MDKQEKTDVIALTEAALCQVVGYSRWYLRMAKRAGFAHQFPCNRSSKEHWLDWLQANPDFQPAKWVTPPKKEKPTEFKI